MKGRWGTKGRKRCSEERRIGREKGKVGELCNKEKVERTRGRGSEVKGRREEEACVSRKEEEGKE